MLNIVWVSEAHNKLLNAIDMLDAKQSEQIKEWASLVGWDPIWAAAVEEGHMSWIDIKSITVIDF